MARRDPVSVARPASRASRVYRGRSRRIGIIGRRDGPSLAWGALALPGCGAWLPGTGIKSRCGPGRPEGSADPVIAQHRKWWGPRRSEDRRPRLAPGRPPSTASSAPGAAEVTPPPLPRSWHMVRQLSKSAATPACVGGPPRHPHRSSRLERIVRRRSVTSSWALRVRGRAMTAAVRGDPIL
jgi:hypothetical protein